MVIGILKIELLIPGANSLKEKRAFLKSLKDKLRNNFNISVSEVDLWDKWQRATLAVAGVNADSKYLNGQLDRLVDFVERFKGVELLRNAKVKKTYLNTDFRRSNADNRGYSNGNLRESAFDLRISALKNVLFFLRKSVVDYEMEFV